MRRILTIFGILLLVGSLYFLIGSLIFDFNGFLFFASFLGLSQAFIMFALAELLQRVGNGSR